MKLKIDEKYQPYLLLSPWILVFSIFWLYPLIQSFIYSFTEYKTLSSDMSFIGFDNYLRLLEDEVFHTALFNTVKFVVITVPITLCFALILAVAIDKRNGRFKELLKVSYFIPSVTSLVVISLIFKNLYSKDGYINTLANMAGLLGVPEGWLQTTETALPAIMAMDIWIATGYYMIIILAGLQTIPNDLYESAELFGASKIRQFFKITLPLLKPTLLFVLVINTIKSFQIFIEIYVMTKGGPLNSTNTLVYLIYENAFERTDLMGYSSAIAYFLFFIILIFTLIQLKLLGVKK